MRAAAMFRVLAFGPLWYKRTVLPDIYVIAPPANGAQSIIFIGPPS
jgi:hypothetical protein